MKKLTLILTLAVAACAAFAAPEKFLGWKSTDVAVIKAQLAKSNDSVPGYHKVHYTFLLAKLEAPASIDTLAKCEQVVSDAKNKYGVSQSVEHLLLGIFRNSRDYRFLDEIVKSAKYTGTAYYRQYYILNGMVPASATEKRDIALEIAEREIRRGKTAGVATLVDKYIAFSLDDDDAVVVKNIQKLYRLAAPKLTAASNDPWKPIVAKLQLALKSRGAEVK